LDLEESRSHPKTLADVRDDGFVLSRVLGFRRHRGYIRCGAPGVIFTQNVVDLVDQFHKAVRVFFLRGLFAKALPTFIIASCQGSPRCLAPGRQRHAIGFGFRSRSFNRQFRVSPRSRRLLFQQFLHLLQRNLLEVQLRFFLLHLLLLGTTYQPWIDTGDLFKEPWSSSPAKYGYQQSV
jgi:hypothetical protein